MLPGLRLAECEKFPDLIRKLCECAVVLGIHSEMLNHLQLSSLSR
jgi:hypothetical protein